MCDFKQKFGDDRQMISYLFTYGTLLSGIAHPMHELIESYASLQGVGHINGKLYDVGGYPGLVLSNNAKKVVKGEIYLIQNETMLFKYLDDYEGCAAFSRKPYEYQRDIVTVRDEQDHNLLAWTYLYKRPVEQLQLISAGDYLSYRYQGRLKASNA